MKVTDISKGFLRKVGAEAVQVMQTKQLQRESQARLNGFVDELRGSAGVDLSAKNLGEEGTQYISEGLAFNDRCAAHCTRCK